MTEKTKYYDEIRKQYTEAISKDQFYRIAHISKATALYLLQSGLVPCKDSGKKTRRYTIRIDDVIFYMINREKHPEVYQAPVNWYKGRSGYEGACEALKNRQTKLSEEERTIFQKYLEAELKDYNDLMTVAEVVEVIGYSNTTIHRWCQDKKIKAFKPYGRFLIPQISLIDFLASQKGFDLKRKMWKHMLLIKIGLERVKRCNKVQE